MSIPRRWWKISRLLHVQKYCPTQNADNRRRTYIPITVVEVTAENTAQTVYGIFYDWVTAMFSFDDQPRKQNSSHQLILLYSPESAAPRRSIVNESRADRFHVVV